MTEPTLKGIAASLDRLTSQLDTVTGHTASLVVDVPEIKTDIKAVREIQDIHTGALDKLMGESQTKGDEKIVSAERFGRLEKWAQQVGVKLGIELKL